MIVVELNKNPSGCHKCNFSQEMIGEIVCVATSDIRKTNYHGKPSWCPIKEVQSVNNNTKDN